MTETKIKEMETDVEYFVHKRNLKLERFNRYVEEKKPLEQIENAYEGLIRMQKQLLLMEDALKIYKITTDGSRII